VTPPERVVGATVLALAGARYSPLMSPSGRLGRMSGSSSEERRTATSPAGPAAPAGFGLPPRWSPVRLLGRGGQGDVWLALDRELGEEVAVKVFAPGLGEAARERLRREVRLGRKLRHSGLVRVYELVEVGERPAVIMELVGGGSLRDRLAAGPLPAGEVAWVAEQVLDVLSYLHGMGILHRDIKPSNLLLDGEGRVRLADLGLARLLDQGGDLTRTAMTVGTPGYMSPEQIRGETPVPASDLYGLGATLYQLLTGARPYEGASEFAVADLHLRGTVPDPRRRGVDCPNWLARFVMRLMQKAPEDRWPDARAALKALRQRRVLVSPRTVRRALLGVAAVAAVAVLGSAGWAAFQRGRVAAVEVVGSEVRGRDDRGRTVWRHVLRLPVTRHIFLDLDGDGDDELVVSTGHIGTERAAREPVEVVIFDRAGRVLSRLEPEKTAAPWWSYDYPIRLQVRLFVLDVDGDGRPEILANCPQEAFYPNALFLFDPDGEPRWEPLLIHAGHLYHFAAVRGADPPRLQFVGVNNRLGMSPVVGELILSRSSASGKPRHSPESGYVPGEADGWSWYRPLVEGIQVTARSRQRDDGGRCWDEDLCLDRWGNDVGGPNAGKDLASLRGSFLRAIHRIGVESQPADRAGVLAIADGLRTGHAELLAEPPYRAVTALATAGALARLGHLEEAAATLRRAMADTGYEEVAFHLAHLEALAGRHREAERLLLNILATQRTPRAYDARHLLLRVAIESRDPNLAERALLVFSNLGVALQDRHRIGQSMRSRVNLWWDQVVEGDTAVASWAYAPEGEAVACLARWRLGRTRPEDPQAMAEAIDANPDAADEGQLALAAALLGFDRAGEAAMRLDALIQSLETRAREDFEKRQLLDLARALRCRALRDAGQLERARRAAAALAPSLTPGLLPAILAAEV
jgi:hypothetical protein